MQLHPDVASVDTEYGTVLLDERKGKYWQLNSTGALVVRILSGGDGVDQAIDLMVQQFKIDSVTARQDVEELIHALQAAGLVTA